MKRKLSILLITTMLISLIPASFAFALGSSQNSFERENPVIFYLYKDFESQSDGDLPYSFVAFDKSSGAENFNTDHISVRTKATDSNSENKAMKLAGVTVSGTNPRASARHGVHYVPINKDFVISFEFYAENFDADKMMSIYYNVNKPRNMGYWDTESSRNIYSFNLFKVDTNGKVTVNGGSTAIATSISAKRWYRVDIAVNMGSRKAEVTFNGGEPIIAAFPSNLNNIGEFRISTPNLDGSDWYLDNIKLYESSTVLSDELLKEEWDKYTSSELYSGEKYEMSRIYNYDKFVYYTLYNKFLAAVGGSNFYKDNEIHRMSAPIREKSDGRIIIPIREFAESLGAVVGWDSTTRTLTIDYKNKNIKVTVGDDIYYLNGKPAKLYHPVSIENGAACIQLDVLAHLFGIKYTRNGDILNFGDPIEFDHDLGAMKTTWGGKENTYEEEIMSRTQFMLTCYRPKEEEILAAYKATYPDNSHPRLLVEDFESIVKGMEKEPALKKSVEDLINNAEKRLSVKPVTYGLSDGLRSTFATTLYNNGMAFGFAYKIAETRYNMATTEEEREKYKAEMKKYADRAWLDIANMESFPDFNPGHFLCTGNSANGVALYYDWMYSAWNEEQREVLEGIIYRNVLMAAYNGFSFPIYSQATAFSWSQGNQPIIINNGLMSCAIALIDRYPELCSEVIKNAIRSVEPSFYDYYPDGQWVEGISYWQYTADTCPFFIKNLQVGLGDDFGISDVPGFLNTAYFPLGMRGSKQTFAVGDDTPTAPYHGMMMFQAEQTGDIPLAKLRKDNIGAGNLIDVICWVYDTDNTEFNINDIETDHCFETMGTATMRTGWSSSDTMLLFHGGGNDDGHGHLDAGSFQFDMLGTRWACEVPKESYNLTGYGGYNTSDTDKNYPEGYKYSNRHYYRFKGEGHNLVLANYANTANGLGTGYADVKTNGRVNIVRKSFGETGSYVIGDLTDTNVIYDCALRGVKLDKVNNEIVVQDDFLAKQPTEFWWFMHTQATIDISKDGKSAILSRNGNRIHAQIISDGDYRFIEMEAKPLDEQGYNYGTDYPWLQTSNTEGKSVLNDVTATYRKLAVKTNKDTDHFTLSVSFTPLVGDATKPDHISEYVPMETWKFESTERAVADNILIDGKPLEGFDPDIYNYGVEVQTEKSPIPQFEIVQRDTSIETKVIQAKTIPGTANIVMYKNGTTVGMYTIAITPINDTSKFFEENQIPIVSYRVTSEPQPENAAVNLFDSNFGTKFATDEDGGCVTVDFGEVINKLHSMKIACVNGNKRTENFKIEYSLDGDRWITVFDGHNSGTTTEFEEYLIGDVPARYARVSFYGNSTGTWVSVSEVYFTKK